MAQQAPFCISRLLRSGGLVVSRDPALRGVNPTTDPRASEGPRDEHADESRRPPKLTTSLAARARAERVPVPVVSQLPSSSQFPAILFGESDSLDSSTHDEVDWTDVSDGGWSSGIDAWSSGGSAELVAPTDTVATTVTTQRSTDVPLSGDGPIDMSSTLVAFPSPAHLASLLLTRGDLSADALLRTVPAPTAPRPRRPQRSRPKPSPVDLAVALGTVRKGDGVVGDCAVGAEAETNGEADDDAAEPRNSGCVGDRAARQVSPADHEHAFVRSMVDLAWMATVGDAGPPPRRSPEAWFNEGVRWQRQAADRRPKCATNKRHSGAALRQALAAFEAAAAAGHVKAMVNAAALHLQGGAGVDKDPARALLLVETAADHGDPRALAFLGRQLLNTRKARALLPVEADPARGRRLLQRASELSRNGGDAPLSKPATCRGSRMVAEAGFERTRRRPRATRATSLV
mmetsp:Transcript_33188/g.86779  ORF Transcript_33188/g.86779 Transcript_33188/m.86779 type:complete len:460 (-) Transcript_33188:1813-3192(-)